jgi:predicted nucleic acid-binding protein
VKRLAAKDRDVDPDFADLALVALTERLGTDAVLTVDLRNFAIYRLRSGKPLVNLLQVGA